MHLNLSTIPIIPIKTPCDPSIERAGKYIAIAFVKNEMDNPSLRNSFTSSIPQVNLTGDFGVAISKQFFVNNIKSQLN